ncbi:hypothetical protein EON64_10810, partial [archaeon]
MFLAAYQELDDRGLLEGGGSVPSYYTSIKQKSRRLLELQPRSSRLQERGKEVVSKLLHSLFHMLRVLSRRGLDLESYWRQRDGEGRGAVSRRVFLLALRQLLLPFSVKELQEVAQHYAEGSEQVRFESFLQDARLLRKSSAESGVQGQ